MTLSPTRDDSARALLEARLDDPAVVASLSSLLDHADLLAILLVALDGFVARTEVIGDSLIEGISDLRAVASDGATGFDPAALVGAGKDLAGALPAIASAAPALAALVEDGALEQLTALTEGLAEGQRQFATQPVHIGGVLSLAKLVKDPDINRALSYGATVAKSLGRSLAVPTPSTTHQS